MERSVQSEFFFRLAQLVICAAEAGIAFRPTSFFRTSTQQNILFRAGLTPVDGYTRRSKHQDGLAIDMVVERAGLPINDPDDPDYDRVGPLWEELGGWWGGRQVMPNGARDAFHPRQTL